MGHPQRQAAHLAQAAVRRRAGAAAAVPPRSSGAERRARSSPPSSPAPATDRLAAAFLDCGARDAGVRALAAYDRWLGRARRRRPPRRARAPHEGHRARARRCSARSAATPPSSSAACSCCCSTPSCSRTCASTGSSNSAPAPRVEPQVVAVVRGASTRRHGRRARRRNRIPSASREHLVGGAERVGARRRRATAGRAATGARPRSRASPTTSWRAKSAASSNAPGALSPALQPRRRASARRPRRTPAGGGGRPRTPRSRPSRSRRSPPAWASACSRRTASRDHLVEHVARPVAARAPVPVGRHRAVREHDRRRPRALPRERARRSRRWR